MGYQASVPLHKSFVSDISFVAPKSLPPDLYKSFGSDIYLIESHNHNRADSNQFEMPVHFFILSAASKKFYKKALGLIRVN
jgi:hypothetical protein